MTDERSRPAKPVSRRTLLKGSLATGAGIGALSLSGIAPLHFVREAWADEQPIGNYPKATSGPTITLGFNVPQTGAYAEEGKDELQGLPARRQHLNGEGDGGMLADDDAEGAQGQRHPRQEGRLSSAATPRPRPTWRAPPPSRWSRRTARS